MLVPTPVSRLPREGAPRGLEQALRRRSSAGNALINLKPEDHATTFQPERHRQPPSLGDENSRRIRLQMVLEGLLICLHSSFVHHAVLDVIQK